MSSIVYAHRIPLEAGEHNFVRDLRIALVVGEIVHDRSKHARCLEYEYFWNGLELNKLFFRMAWSMQSHMTVIIFMTREGWY